MPNIHQVRRVLLRAPAAGNVYTDPDYLAWAAAVGSVGATQATATHALILSLKAHSLWTTQDRIWLHASENPTQALTCIKSLTVASAVNSPTFNANQGYTGDAASAYIDTNTVLSSLSNYTTDDGSISSYIRNNRTSDANEASFGSYDGINSSMMFPLGAGLFIYDVNNTPFGANNFSNSSTRGFWTSVRTATLVLATYKNSSSTAVGTSTTVSLAVPTVSAFILARNNNGGGAQYNTGDQVSITAIGSGMTNGTNVAQFQTDINTYMASLPGNPSVY